MKNIMTAGAFALGLTSTVANAGDFTYFAGTEYAFEAEEMTLEFGADYIQGDLRVTPVIEFADTTATNLEFTTLSVEAGYMVTSSAEVYLRVETDENLDHSETVVGATIHF